MHQKEVWNVANGDLYLRKQTVYCKCNSTKTICGNTFFYVSFYLQAALLTAMYTYIISLAGKSDNPCCCLPILSPLKAADPTQNNIQTWVLFVFENLSWCNLDQVPVCYSKSHSPSDSTFPILVPIAALCVLAFSRCGSTLPLSE